MAMSTLQVLDYSAGSALNPLLPPPDGRPSVQSVLIDVPANQILEQDPDGNQTTSSVTARLGGAYLTSDSFRVLLSQPAELTLGSGNDTLVSTYLWATDAGGRQHYLFPESTIDGGAGFDAIEVQANTSLTLSITGPFVSGLTLHNVEALRFDPATSGVQRNEATVAFPAGTAFPFAKVVGSPGIDVLTLQPMFPQGANTLDLRNLVLDGFGDTPPLVVGDTQYNEEMRVSFSVGATGLNTLYAHPNVAMKATVLDSADTALVGGGKDDWFTLPPQGGGANFVDGKGSYDVDVVFLPGPSTAYTYLPGGDVRGSSVEFRLQDKRPAIAPPADGFINVEVFGFSDGYFTPAQLAGGTVPQLPTVNFNTTTQRALAEGTPPQAGGEILVTLERTGDLSNPSSVNWRLMPDSSVGHPASADDLALAFAQSFTAQFAAGQASLQLAVPLRPDGLQEYDETFFIELTSALGAKLGIDTSLRLSIVNDDNFNFTLVGATRSNEGAPYVLTITPVSASGFFGSDDYRVDWGDGSPLQTFSSAQLFASSGALSHVFADGARAGTATNITVTARVPGGNDATLQQALTVLDVAPTLGVQAANVAQSDTAYYLQLGAYADAGDDPLLGLRIDWGDGSQSTVAPGASNPYHLFTSLAARQITVYANNDDGEFVVGTQGVLVAASAGNAPANGPSYAWAAAWSDSLISFSHKAYFGNPAEPWTAVSLGALNSGVLAGGDIYGGLLGVSGRTANTSTVRQEIDGTEALRIELAAGNRANTLTLDLARLFTNDAGSGLNEAGRVLFFDGNTQVGSSIFIAQQFNGRLHLEFIDTAPFTRVVLQPGAIDENGGGVFVPGGMVDASGGYVATAAGLGSDFMLEAVQFMLVPPTPPAPAATAVDLVGLALADIGAFGTAPLFAGFNS
jgi:hypothetical protein